MVNLIFCFIIEKAIFGFKKVSKKIVGKEVVFLQKLKTGYKIFVGSSVISLKNFSEVRSFIRNFKAISA